LKSRNIHGGRSRKHVNRGTVLLDVAVALFAASIAFGVTIGGIALAARTARIVRERFMNLVSVENEQAQTQKRYFTIEEQPE
jgi:orotate phosphoribosyltransferase